MYRYALNTPVNAWIVTAAYNGISLWNVAWAQAQSASAPRREAVQCAALSVVPSLAAIPIAPAATGDTTGYYLYTPEMQLLAETAVTAAASKPVAYSYLWFGGVPVASVDAATGSRENVNPNGSPGIYALTQAPYSPASYPSGLWNATAVAGTGPNCQFEKCALKTFQAQQNIPGLVPPYNATGPNSNTFVHDLINQCGGSAPRPPRAVGYTP